MTPGRVRVLVVDDHPVVIESLARCIEAEPDLELVGSARDATGAAAAIERLDPDVVVCDIQMGGETEGLRLLEALGSRARPAFLMLSAFDYAALFRRAHELGAAGYVLKTAELAEVVAAVRVVAGGGRAFSSTAVRRIRTSLRPPSERELEVVRLVVAGHSNEEIAGRLVLSRKTVESHLRRLFDRYGVMNRTELAMLAAREGWVDPGVAW